MTTAREASNRLASLLRHERTAMADFLLELARFDSAKRWRELGHTSLFWYLHKELKVSKAAAQARKAAAELIQTFPEVEAALRSGALCLSTVSRRFLDKLEAARDALAHVFPDGDSAAILERGLDLALAEAAKRKGLVEKPQANPRTSDSDHIPAHVKREVWTRAGGRCEFVLESGERCAETRCLEFDHVKARALGGPSTVANVRVTCRGHNLLAARRTFGGAWTDRYGRGAREPAARYAGAT